jgi:hypothetical protein
MLGCFCGAHLMAIDIGLFKDLAEGISKSVETYDKLLDIIEKHRKLKFNRKRRKELEAAAKALRNFVVMGARERNVLMRGWVPVMNAYRRNPTFENWIKVKLEIASVVNRLNQLLRLLSDMAPEFGTKEFYPPLFDTIFHRVSILAQILKAPEPRTEDDRMAIYQFFEDYTRTMERFTYVNQSAARKAEEILSENS